jgi:hypothetical protein
MKRTFVSRYKQLGVTWPKGTDNTIRFVNGRFSTEDTELAGLLATLRTCSEIKNAPPATEKNPDPPRGGKHVFQLLNTAAKMGVCTKEKGFFRYDDQVIGKSLDDINAFFGEHPEIEKAIEAAVSDDEE